MLVFWSRRTRSHLTRTDQDNAWSWGLDQNVYTFHEVIWSMLQDPQANKWLQKQQLLHRPLDAVSEEITRSSIHPHLLFSWFLSARCVRRVLQASGNDVTLSDAVSGASMQPFPWDDASDPGRERDKKERRSDNTRWRCWCRQEQFIKAAVCWLRCQLVFDLLVSSWNVSK